MAEVYMIIKSPFLYQHHFPLSTHPFSPSSFPHHNHPLPSPHQHIAKNRNNNHHNYILKVFFTLLSFFSPQHTNSLFPSILTQEKRNIHTPCSALQLIFPSALRHGEMQSYIPRLNFPLFAKKRKMEGSLKPCLGKQRCGLFVSPSTS